MASVRDFGGTADRLNQPPLGGPGGWAEAVSKVVDDSDVTVNARIAALVPTTRITRPNTDDRLMEVWNGAAWSVVGYDSGWRNVNGLLASPFTAFGDLLLRATLDRVDVIGAVNINGATLPATAITMPAGFRAAVTYQVLMQPRDGQRAQFVDTNNVTIQSAPIATIDVAWSWAREPTLPTSLPGTLITAAPA